MSVVNGMYSMCAHLFWIIMNQHSNTGKYFMEISKTHKTSSSSIVLMNETTTKLKGIANIEY